jgi:hypothetical protein
MLGFGYSQLNSKVARYAASNWAEIKPSVSIGRMPADVSLAARAKVTAVWANEVEDVNICRGIKQWRQSQR